MHRWKRYPARYRHIKLVSVYFKVIASGGNPRGVPPDFTFPHNRQSFLSFGQKAGDSIYKLFDPYLPSIDKSKHGFSRQMKRLPALSSLPGVSPAASSALADRPICSRKTRWISAHKIVRTESLALLIFCCRKAYLPLSIDGSSVIGI